MSIPLLPKATSILEKYENELPIVSNQCFNGYLKEIANLCRIEKKLTHHIARKTFATTVLLLNGVSMEIASKLLGHSRIGITQASYGEVNDKVIMIDIRRLINKS